MTFVGSEGRGDCSPQSPRGTAPGFNGSFILEKARNQLLKVTSSRMVILFPWRPIVIECLLR